MTTLLIGGLAAGIALVAFWPRYGLMILTASIGGCAVEREIGLRRLSRRLSDERTLSSALSDRLDEITGMLDTGRAQVADMAYRAVHDPLTSLPNRTVLEAVVNETFDLDQPFALLFVDLDGFKGVNDTHGHQAGDVLLAAAASRMHSAIGSDDLTARLGGDEFAVVLRGVRDAAVAMQIARRLLDSLVEPFAVDGHRLQVSASVGVALAGVHGVDFAGLLRAADRALYAAKDAGRGCSCVFDPVTMQPEINRATDAAVIIPLPRVVLVRPLFNAGSA